MNTPSRNVIALLIICITIIAIVIFIDAQRKNAPVSVPSLTSTEEYGTISVAKDLDTNKESDIDNDGLKDWEETIWKTDPANADSDADGKTDGQEVLQDRNPMKAGPNDLLSDEDIEEIGENAIAEGYTKGSVSDNFSKRFFENYLMAKDGGELDIAGPDAMIKDLVTTASTEIRSTIYYARSEITTFPLDPVKAKVYGNAFAAIQAKKIQDILAATKTNSLPAIALEYKKFSEELFKLQVPEELADVHLQIINNIYLIHEAYMTLSDYEKDPIKSLFAIKEHKRIETEQVTLYTRVKNYFVKNGIIFDNSESGVLWNNF